MGDISRREKNRLIAAEILRGERLVGLYAVTNKIGGKKRGN